MPEHDLEKLLVEYATGTLTPDERQRLFQAALQDQSLFNAIADEQALKELLDDPIARRQVLAALQTGRTSEAPPWRTAVADWFRRPANLAWAGGLATLVLAVVLGQRIYQDHLRPQSKTIAMEATHGPQQSGPEVVGPTQESAPRPAEPPLTTTEGKQADLVGDKPGDPSAGGLRKSTPKETASAPTPQAQAPLREQVPAGDAPIPFQPRDERQTMRTAPAEERAGTGKSASPPGEAGTAQPASPPTTSGKAEGPAAPAPGEGARALFYVAIDESHAESAPQGRRQLEVPLQMESELRTQPQRKEAPRADRPMKPFAAIEGGRTLNRPPLALRYGLLIQGPGGTELEVAPDSPLGEGAEPILTLETNQPGYLYVWKELQAGEQRLVFPPESGPAGSEPVLARTRYRISLGRLGEQQPESHQPHVLVLYTRQPQRDPRATALKPSAGLLIDRISPNQAGTPVEQAVYVATADPSPAARIVVEFVLTTR
jgi:hypothetical protein